jgi:hypothetical protein
MPKKRKEMIRSIPHKILSFSFCPKKVAAK